MFSFNKKTKGLIGIACIDNGVTLGQCAWSNGLYTHPKLIRLERNPRELTSDDWRSAIHDTGLSGSDCVVTLPPSMINHQVLRLPEMSESEIKEAASWEMSERFGIDRNKLQSEAIRIGSGGDVLALSIELDELECILEPIYAAGLRPIKVEAQCISISRTFSMLHRRQSDQGKVRSLFNFGLHDSSFIILDGDSMVFYKQLHHKQAELLGAIESHTGVSQNQAASMLEEARFDGGESAICKAVRDATRSIHEEITTDIMKCLRHYGVTNRGPLSTCIYITGKGGWNQFLGELLTTACNQEVCVDMQASHVSQLRHETLSVPGWHAVLGASLATLSGKPSRRGEDHQLKEAA